MDKTTKILNKVLNELGIILEAFDISNVTPEDTEWLDKNRNQHPLHPAVRDVITLGTGPGYARLKSILMYEWPTAKGNDLSMVEYTPSTIAGRRGNKSTTKIRTYIYNRFEPFIKDKEKLENYILAAEMNLDNADFEILHTREDMVGAIMDYKNSLCHSCMQSSKYTDTNTHPYNVYDPKLGWGLAVLYLPNGRLAARALVNDKKYVQIYPKQESNDTIYNIMKDLLESHGYTQVSGWEGYHIRANIPNIPHMDGMMDRGYQKAGSDIITLGDLSSIPKTGTRYTLYLLTAEYPSKTDIVW